MNRPAAHRVIVLLAAAAGAAVPAGAVLGQSYQAVPLPSLVAGGEAVALGINDLGDVVGQSETASGVLHAIYWRNGVASDLAPLAPMQTSRALSINSAGQVVGSAQDGQGRERATMWQQDRQGVWQATDLGTLPGGTFSIANRISENGHVVGR